MPNSPINELKKRFSRLSRIEEAAALLHWDQAVVMPPGGAGARAEQLATLSSLVHEILTDQRTADLLALAEDEVDDSLWERANLRLIRHRIKRATALEPDFVAHQARTFSLAEGRWREARRADDFRAFECQLEEVVGIVREASICLGMSLELEPYDALIDEFQPGLIVQSFAPLFEELETKLPSVLARLRVAPVPVSPPSRPVAPDLQEALFRQLMARIGFDFDYGRLDESTHPFCGGVFGDHRITTRYTPTDIAPALMGVLHETGHALYEAGLPLEWHGQPVGQAHGMVVHESQSLFVEMQLCRSSAFLEYLSQILISAFGFDEAWSKASLTQNYRSVTPGLIRVDADEVTYPLHVIHRFKLERALLSGDLSVGDLPAAWNDLLYEMLGVRPDNDRDGCLQDIHWSTGTFGYFPCYTLGALLAAQLVERLQDDIRDLDQLLQNGELETIVGWLRKTIHSRASSLDYEKLIVESTGKPLSTDAFLAHLDRRYVSMADN